MWPFKRAQTLRVGDNDRTSATFEERLGAVETQTRRLTREQERLWRDQRAQVERLRLLEAEAGILREDEHGSHRDRSLPGPAH